MTKRPAQVGAPREMLPVTIAPDAWGRSDQISFTEGGTDNGFREHGRTP